MTDLLVIAAPTIDIIPPRRSPRPGGPTLYAGYAGKVFGCRPTAIGPVGLESVNVVLEAHKSLGVNLAPAIYPGAPYTFRLVYEEHGREAVLAGMPSTRSLSTADIATALNTVRPDVVLFAPVSLEVPPSALPLATLSGARVVAVDPQGYARAFGNL